MIGGCRWRGLAVPVGECDRGWLWQRLWLRGAAVGLGTGHARVFLAVGLFGMKWAGRTKRKLVLGKFLVLGLFGIGPTCTARLCVFKLIGLGPNNKMKLKYKTRKMITT